MADTPDHAARQRALTLAQFLRHHGPLKNRAGVLDGKRVDYFKGKYALRVLLSPTCQQRLSHTMTSQDDAIAAFHLLLQYGLIHRVDKLAQRKEKKKGIRLPRRLRLHSQQTVEENAYYAWLYDHVPLMTILLSLVILILIFAAIVYPLWPPALRRMVYYLSWVALGLIMLLVLISLIRLVIYLISLILLPPGLWLFPNLYEDVGFIDSFRPLWDWHKEKPKSRRKTATTTNNTTKE